MIRPCAVLSLAAVAACAAALPAQAGHLPTNSPYEDFSYKQEVTLYTGWFTGATGRAGVGPQGAPLLGARYALHLGGPVELSAHVARAFSDRLVLSPADTGAARNRGTFSVPLYLADVGLTFNLTGEKSWHHLVPIFGFGGGLVSDGGTQKDIGDFGIGTTFAITFGTGIRYVPGGSWSARLEIADYMYQAQYPNTYFAAPVGGTSILPAASPQNQWLHNGVFTLGVSYMFRSR